MSRDITSVVTDELFDAYWNGVEHYGTTDLVLYFIEGEHEAKVFSREQMITADLPPELDRLRRPARETNAKLKASTAFWLIAAFGDEEVIVAAIHAERVGPGPEGLQ